MTDPEQPPIVLPASDADYECVLVDPEAAAAPGAAVVTPPDPDAPAGGGRAPLCPPGYVPRLRRRGPYQLRGKEIVAPGAPEENPAPPPA